MMKYPTGSSSSTDSQNDFENANRIRLTPNPAQHTETHLPRPFTPERTAKVSAPSNAPTPAAPIRYPQSHRAQIVRSDQRSEFLPAAVQDFVGENRHQHYVGHARHAHDPQQHH